ncbi:MAG: calcium/sodium antiporter [Acutalibacteraceae bacterium]|nr:calcium/sodium antiporter [Acutalibacteraceae bacterium]
MTRELLISDSGARKVDFEMEIIIPILLFIVGIVFVVKGGDIFVDSASWIAEVSGIPKLIVGATIVSFATTLPELLVSVFAAIEGSVDISIGNAFGSVTANIGLIMAIAILCMPSPINRSDYMLKTVLMLGSAAMVVIFGAQGSFSMIACIVLLIIFAISMTDNVRNAVISMRESNDNESTELLRASVTARTVTTNIVKFILGAVMIVIGAQLLVDNGTIIAEFFKVPERVIGITIIAVGTSLPELVTTLTAIRKHESSLSAGNIIGANIIDITLIMPLASLISGKALPVSSTVAMLDLPACLIVGSIAMIPTLITKRFSRWQGVVLLVVYAAYITISCII